MFVSPNLVEIPNNMTPVMNIGSESIVLIPSDLAILKSLMTDSDVGMLVISDDDWDMVADNLKLPSYIDGVNESYFADRCQAHEIKEKSERRISRQGYAAIFDDGRESGLTAIDSIKAIPNIVRVYQEDTVLDLLNRYQFDYAGLTEREMVAAAIGVVSENSGTGYDRHYEVDGVTMVLHTNR